MWYWNPDSAKNIIGGPGLPTVYFHVEAKDMVIPCNIDPIASFQMHCLQSHSSTLVYVYQILEYTQKMFLKYDIGMGKIEGTGHKSYSFP